jgi:hypothetical protein
LAFTGCISKGLSGLGKAGLRYGVVLGIELKWWIAAFSRYRHTDHIVQAQDPDEKNDTYNPEFAPPMGGNQTMTVSQNDSLDN